MAETDNLNKPALLGFSYPPRSPLQEGGGQRMLRFFCTGEGELDSLAPLLLPSPKLGRGAGGEGWLGRGAGGEGLSLS